MLFRPRLSTVALLLTLPSLLAAQAPKKKEPKWPPAIPVKHNYAKWEPAIAAFKKEDAKGLSPKGCALFVGSSTMVLWKTLQQDFAGIPVVNRGFGGNQTKDCTYYAEQTIFPHDAKVIVLRGGSNDINAGWPVERVFADHKAFVAKVRSRLPQTHIVILGVFPAIKRKAQIQRGNQLNDLLLAYCKTEPRLTFIDTRNMTLDGAGELRPELFAQDLLHLSPKGYQVLTATVRPVVERLMKDKD
jgi:lysophospholipase L1-like esterase